MKFKDGNAAWAIIRIFILTLFWMAGLLHGSAYASTSVGFDPDHTPPVHSIFTRGSVDAKTGKFRYESLDMSIGSGQFPSRLDLVRTHLDDNVRFGLEVRAVCVGCKPYSGNAGRHPANFNARFWGAVHIILAEKTYAFHKTSADGEYQNSSRNGASLVATSNQRLEFTSGEGVKAFFDFSENHVCGYETPEPDRVTAWKQASCLVARQLVMPDGQGLAFTYDAAHDGYYTSHTLARLRSVVNTSGYGINFTYGMASNRTLVTNASGFRIGCVNSETVGCSVGLSPSVSYEWTNFPQMLVRPLYRLTAFTDSEGRRTTYQYTTQRSRMESVRYPDRPSHNAFTNFYLQNGKVDYQIDVSGNTNQYTYESNQTLIEDPSGGITIYGFSGSKALPDWIQDQNGNRTTYSYDQYFRVTRLQRPGGRAALEYDYDVRGNILEMKEVPEGDEGTLSRITKFSFPACTANNYRICNKPSYQIAPDGARTDYSYHMESGGISGVLYPSDHNGDRALVKTSYGVFYPAGGVVVESNAPHPDLSFSTIHLPVMKEECLASASSAGANCAAGNSIKTIFSYTQSSQSQRSSFDLKSVTVDSGGLNLITRYKYDRIGNLVQEIGPLANGSTTTYTYNRMRQPISSRQTGIDGEVTETQIQYDMMGRLQRTSQRLGTSFLRETEVIRFNDKGLPEEVAGPGGERILYTYDQSGRLSTATQQVDGKLRGTYLTYDAAGRLVRTERRLNGSIVDFMDAAYSDAGDMLEQRDAAGNVTRFCHDHFGQMIERRMSSPEGGAVPTCEAVVPGGQLPEGITRERYAYDARGNVVEVVFRSGDVLDLVYDSRGNLIEENAYGDGRTVQYAYDILGRMVAAELPGQNDLSVYFSYDNAGRVLTESGAYGHTIQHQYSAQGDRETLQWPGNFSAHYHLDGLQRVKTVTLGEEDQLIAGYSYDGLSRATQIIYGNGVLAELNYNDGPYLDSLSFDIPEQGKNIEYSYSYNNAGQILSRIGSNRVYAWRPNGSSQKAYYPSAESVQGGGNALNQYGYIESEMPEGTVGHALSYDDNGNLAGCTALGEECEYVYDSLNRLVSASDVELTYDALGRLVQVAEGTQTIQFLYAGMKLVGEYQDGQWRRTIHGAGQDAPLWVQEGNTQTWLHADERGSIIAGTNETGATTFVNSYGPFGEHGPTHTGRFGFTGQVWIEEIGLYHFKARFYSPKMGRFLQPDPMGEAAGPNLYAYADNDPINLVDSLGLSPHVPGGPARLPPIIVTPHDRGPQWTAAMMPTMNPGIPSAQMTGRTWSSYLPGTGAGHNAAQYWADMATNSNHFLAPLANVPGVFASLWTNQTAAETAFTLGTAGFSSLSYFSRIRYFRYIGPNSNPSSRWLLARVGSTAPYASMQAAKQALQLPYMPTMYQRVSVPWWRPVVGPRSVVRNPQWGAGGGKEWYQGWRFPD